MQKPNLEEKFSIDFSAFYLIWFSPRSDEFLPVHNQERIKSLRTRYPAALLKLTLITSDERLSPEAKTALTSFSESHDIELVDIKSIQTSTMDNRAESELYGYLKDELESADDKTVDAQY
ncbi:MAG: glycosyltransferase family 88 protein, partial [Pseudomonadota bacterium]